MRIMIVDDHEIVREGVRAALSADPRIEVVAEAASGKEALRRVRQTLPPLDAPAPSPGRGRRR